MDLSDSDIWNLDDVFSSNFTGGDGELVSLGLNQLDLQEIVEWYLLLSENNESDRNSKSYGFEQQMAAARNGR